MKQVIRYGVFETNSSSTHSLCIKKCDLKNKTDKDASFEIRSAPAKIVWLQGLINNAKHEFNQKKEEYFNEEIDYRTKICILNIVKKQYPSLFDKLNEIYNCDVLNQTNSFILQDKIIKLGFREVLNNLDYSKYVHMLIEDLLYEYDIINYLDRFMDVLIDTYSKIENISKKKAISNINQEAKGKIGFCPYFSEGSLDLCFCGFDDCVSLKNKLWEFNIDVTSSKEELIEGAKTFLSNEYKIVGEEYIGEEKIGGGTIY